MPALVELLERALAGRGELIRSDAAHATAWRLFNGFTEGAPELTLDVYGGTLLITSHAAAAESVDAMLEAVLAWARERLPWVRCLILKRRRSAEEQARNGRVVWGGPPERCAVEEGVRYALELTSHQDASFFLDTSGLRRWCRQSLAGKSVLNTFAYTGSLGVAAKAGGASRVVHLDRNRRPLNVAKASYALNGWPVVKSDFVAGDFFTETSRMRRSGVRFDCVILDPPFFSRTARGEVDLENSLGPLINKVRPLVEAGGALVCVNNALFVPGAQYVRELEALCQDGYLTLETLIPVPGNMIGAAEPGWPADPAPFNHPTKIAVLRVQRRK